MGSIGKCCCTPGTDCCFAAGDIPESVVIRGDITINEADWTRVGDCCLTHTTTVFCTANNTCSTYPVRECETQAAKVVAKWCKIQTKVYLSKVYNRCGSQEEASCQWALTVEDLYSGCAGTVIYYKSPEPTCESLASGCSTGPFTWGTNFTFYHWRTLLFPSRPADGVSTTGFLTDSMEDIICDTNGCNLYTFPDNNPLTIDSVDPPFFGYCGTYSPQSIVLAGDSSDWDYTINW